MNNDPFSSAAPPPDDAPEENYWEPSEDAPAADYKPWEDAPVPVAEQPVKSVPFQGATDLLRQRAQKRPDVWTHAAGLSGGGIATTRSDAAIVEGLNPQQKEAVIHGGSPLLIMAGAGSGKTRVLTHRIAYLLETGRAYPGQILAITFTNKAAGEMRERVQSLVGPAGRSIWVSTFHSACVRILREHHDAAGLKSTFSIYDQQDQLRLIGMVLRDLNIDTKRFTARFVLGRISDLKNELIGPSDYAHDAPGDPISQLISQVFSEITRGRL